MGFTTLRRGLHLTGRPIGAILLVVVLLAATVTGFLLLQRAEDVSAREDAVQHSLSTAVAIERRVDAYIEVLFGMRSYVLAAPLNHEVFENYVEPLELGTRFPGAQVVGVAPLVPGTDADIYTAEMDSSAAAVRADYPAFDIYPAGERSEMLLISYVHPIAGNGAAFGLDFLAIENRASAALAARDSGSPAATAPTTLVQETGSQLAFLVMVPWYDTPTTPVTVQERREHFGGVVYAAFRMGDLVAGVADLTNGAEVTVVDLGAVDADESAQETMFSSTGEDIVAIDVQASEVQVIEVAGRRWAIGAVSGDSHSGLDGALKWVTTIAGAIVTLLVLFALLAGERATRANVAKSKFLSRMSHELRTPLNAVIGFSQILQLENPDTEQSEQAAQIETAGRHLLLLIDEVLQVSRIEAGEMTMSVEAVPVEAVVHEVWQLLTPQAASAGLELSMHIHADHVLVKADRQRLSQVLLNLGSNAIKYNRPGGTVEITTESAPNGGCRILVRDTGHGIAAEDRSRLFVPFDRLGAEATNVEGVGLGLTLTKMLVGEMGGALGLSSVVGEGTTFWVDLELSVAQLKVRSDVIPAKNKTQRDAVGRILAVEDNETNDELVRSTLAHLPGVELFNARNGAEAINIAKDRAIDLMLLDVNLPDTDGERLLHQLREIVGQSVPAVMLSADATEETIRRLEAAGADAYLTKPFDVDDLLNTVSELLNILEPEPVTG